jgi:hypothetical protein
MAYFHMSYLLQMGHDSLFLPLSIKATSESVTTLFRQFILGESFLS